MNWLALSFGEVLALWVAASALALFLYLHSRRPLRHRVSTLRFWTSAQGAPMLQRRWLREPWALVAQILLLLLLIAALANPHWGRQDESRSVVMVLDTSVWSQAQPRGGAQWIDSVRDEANRVLDSLPSGDRVLLLRTEPDALPILPSTSDRAALKRAIAGVSASSVVADVAGALESGRAPLNGSRRGLLVYVGPGLIDDRQSQQLDEFRQRLAQPGSGEVSPQFLVRLVGDPASIQNRGITGLALRRDDEHPDQWSVLTEIKNYSSTRANVVLNLSVGGKSLQQRSLTLAPGAAEKVQDNLTWADGGFLHAEITPADELGADDRAEVEIPTFRPVRVGVSVGQSTFATNLEAVLAANPYVDPRIFVPGATGGDKPDVNIYAGVSPPAHPSSKSIWFVGGAKGALTGTSTSTSAGTSTPVRIVNWNSQHPATRWIRTHDVSVRNPARLSQQPNDVVLAYADGNPPTPIILAREQDGHRMLILGFDPQDSNLQFESAFPLLMAGSIEWLTQPIEDVVQSASTGIVDLRSAATRIVAPSGAAVAFERADGNVRFFASEAGIYRLTEPSRERQIAVNIPALPQTVLSPDALEEAAIEPEPIRGADRDLWRWLVLIAAIPLWLEWWLFYSGRGIRKVEIKPDVSARPASPGQDVNPRWRSADADAREHQHIN